MALATRPVGRGLPITTSSTSSRSVRSLATASSSGTRPFMGTSDDEVTMIRPGDRARRPSAGPEDGVVDADRDDGHPVGLDAHLGGDVASCDDCDTVMIRGSDRATLTCIRRKPNQRRWLNCCHGLVVWLRASCAVDGDRVVEGLERPASRRPSCP